MKYYLFVINWHLASYKVHHAESGLAYGIAHVSGLLEVLKGRLVVGFDHVPRSGQVEFSKHGQGNGVVHLFGLKEEVEG